MGTSDPLASRLRALTDENVQLTEQLTQAQGQIEDLTQQVGQSATLDPQQILKALNRAYTVTRVPAGTAPEHTIVRLVNGVGAWRVVNRASAGNSISPSPPTETLTTYYKRLQASVIVNGSGWWDSGRYMGLSIQDGRLIQGWEGPDFDLGIESLVIMADGTLKVYDRSTTPQRIIADGGQHSITWGRALYRDGKLTGIHALERYQVVTARQMIGDTKDGAVVIVTFPRNPGANGQDVINAVKGLGVNNLYFADGGGSAQTMVNGQYIVRSSDSGGERPVPNVLYFYAPSASA